MSKDIISITDCHYSYPSFRIRDEWMDLGAPYSQSHHLFICHSHDFVPCFVQTIICTTFDAENKTPTD